MKHFKVIYGRVAKILGPNSQLLQLAEQNIYTETDNLELKPPEGYAVINIIEYLKDVKIKAHVKKISN
jgi:hypothetical protein